MTDAKSFFVQNLNDIVASALDDSYGIVLGQQYEATVESIIKLKRKHMMIISLLRFVLQNSLEIFWRDFITVPEITSGKIKKYDSKAQHALAAARNICLKASKSLIFNKLPQSVGLKEVAQHNEETFCLLMELIKKAEAIVRFLEKYLAWLDYGSNLAMRYYNTTVDNEEDEIDKEEALSDKIVQLYAFCKACDDDIHAFLNVMQDTSALFDLSAQLISKEADFLGSFSEQQIGKALNILMTASLSAKENKKNSGLRNALVQFFKEVSSRLKESVNQTDGAVYLSSVVLQHIGTFMVSTLTQDAGNLLTFVKNKKDRHSFITRFEKGALWK